MLRRFVETMRKFKLREKNFAYVLRRKAAVVLEIALLDEKLEQLGLSVGERNIMEELN